MVFIQFIPSVYCDSCLEHPPKNTATKEVSSKIEVVSLLEKEIKALTEEIHAEFGQHSLLMIEGNPPLAKRLAVWSQT